MYKTMADLTGNTPLVELVNIEKNLNLKAKILAKIEKFNPAGSVKDRVAKEMILDAEEKGLLKQGATIIEPTSGNTGIGLAYFAMIKGYKVILTMPESMSLERRKLLKMYGAEIVLTNADLGMQGAIEKANELKREIEGSVILGQFTNPANVKAHYKTTGPEIWKDARGKVDVFVAGVGTGGTLTGVAKYLKEQTDRVEIVAVEPFNSQVLGKGVAGKHGLQGIGANFVPEILDLGLVDKIYPVKEEDAYFSVKELAKTEGLLVGISSGAAFHVAKELAKLKEYEGKNIVVLLPDSGERYMSTELFD